MTLDFLRSLVTRRPGRIVVGWIGLALVVGLGAPDLTRLAAELALEHALGCDVESIRAAEIVNQAWPDSAYESLAVAVLHRPEGLTAADREFALRLERDWDEAAHPREILRVLGSAAPVEVAERLLSRDGTIAASRRAARYARLSRPSTHSVVGWLQARSVGAVLRVPCGTGNPLDWRRRYSAATHGQRENFARPRGRGDRSPAPLVLLAVYRSFLLALMPLVTIGVEPDNHPRTPRLDDLAGWEISPLVESFLVAILFGTGTDFCLFVSWRFGEHFNPNDPAGAMRRDASPGLRGAR